MLDGAGRPRSNAGGLCEALSSLSVDNLEERCIEKDRYSRDRGVAFSLSFEERPFPLDPIPRLVSAEEWRVVEACVAQRVRSLEAFLAGVYRRGETFGDGVVPRRLVATSSHLLLAAARITPANGVRIHVTGTDLVRDTTGRFPVFEDNLRIHPPPRAAWAGKSWSAGTPAEVVGSVP